MLDKREQLEVLRHGVRLLYAWCSNSRLKECSPAEVEFSERIRKGSERLCGVDIFADFRLPDTGLKSIFSDICVPPDSSPPMIHWPHPSPLKVDKIPLPKSPPAEDWRSGAVEEISSNYEPIKENPGALQILLEKFGSFVPIATGEIYNSISLYEHIKFLSCLAGAGSGDKPYLLVSADLSGVQGFIYTISSKGALKSLRARSFFLELLTNHIMYEILAADGGIPANIVYAGGGGFSLLLTNSEQAKKDIQTLKRLVNEWSRNEFQGRIYLGMEWIELSYEEMFAPGFRDAWGRMAKLLEADKRHRFKESLPSVLTEVEEPKLSSEEECQICHRDDLDMPHMQSILDEDIRACPLCLKLFRWGDQLSDYKYVIRESQPPAKTQYIELPSLREAAYYYLSSKRESPPSLTIRLVNNSWDITEYVDGKSHLILSSDYVTKNPQAGDSTADFEFLAGKSNGKKLLGALRMDVDNLGILFTRGLARERFDLPHYSAFSRQLSLFFTVYLNLLCRGKNEQPLDIMGKKPAQGRMVTIVYSGGDDLFIVGAWDEVTELACDIARNFADYTGNNPDVSISGGVILTKHDFPLYQIAYLSKRAEEIAKSVLPSCQSNNCSPSHTDCIFYRQQDKCARKNTGLLFYVPGLRETVGETEATLALPWEDILGKIVPVVKLFRELSKDEVSGHLEVEGLSRSFIRHLFELVDVKERENELYLPLMGYTVSRLNKAISGRMDDPKKRDALKELVGDSYLLSSDVMKVLRVPMTWVEFLMREE
jgi:CRISPR-associated protein Csm1